MKRLRLPIIKGPISESRALSMDEYVKFIQFNLRNTFDRKAYEKWKKMTIVNVPFLIK